MAELVFKNLIEERGVAQSFRVSSRGTSDCEEGSQIYPPAQRTLAQHNIGGAHVARQITKKDVINCDYVLVMDSQNLFDLLRMTGGEYGEKIFKLCTFTNRERDVADPWYTRDFEQAFCDIVDGCEGFLNYIFKKHANELDYDKRH